MGNLLISLYFGRLEKKFPKIDKIEEKSNSEANLKTGDSLIEIGNYLLEKFFDNDLAKVQSRVPKKALSLRTLAARDDLDMSLSHIQRSVNLAVQEHELATVSALKQLTASHKIALLHVEKAEQKKEYIEKIVSGKLSTRQFIKLLQKDCVCEKRGVQTGTKRDGVSKFAAVSKSVFSLDIEEVLKFDSPKVQAVKTEIEKMKKYLDEMIHKLNEMKTPFDSVSNF